MPNRVVFAAAFALAALLASPGAHAAYSEQQKDACQGDAQRLCSTIIQQNMHDTGNPAFHKKIGKCLSYYRAYLSPACKAYFPTRRRR